VNWGRDHPYNPGAATVPSELNRFAQKAKDHRPARRFSLRGTADSETADREAAVTSISMRAHPANRPTEPEIIVAADTTSPKFLRPASAALRGTLGASGNM